MKTKKVLFAFIVSMSIILLMGFAKPNDRLPNEWVAPKWADTLKNPLKGNVALTMEGKKLYVRYCVVCHGDKGKGDGVAGVNLNPRPADHTSAHVQSMSDGALYWMITNGNPPMPTYKAILKDNERWELVNYIRELGKNSSTKTKN